MKTLTINISIVLALMVCLTTSCEKVVDINLNDSNPQLVIEATIVSDGTPCNVRITKTVNFDATNNFPTVDNALVSLNDDAGNTENLQLTSSGLYKSSVMTGVEGRKYTLSVNVDGKNYIAISTLPIKTNLDSLWVDSLSFFGSTTYTVTPQYKDSFGVKNTYRFKLFVNGMVDKTIFVDDDEFNDGRTVSRPYFGDIEIETGDTLRWQMMCIDKAIYRYFFSLLTVQDGSSGAPANPVSNFSGGCLGYFSAHTLQEKMITVN